MNTRANQGVYSAPRLVAYGDVRDITQAVGNMGNADGGSGSAAKSQA